MLEEFHSPDWQYQENAGDRFTSKPTGFIEPVRAAQQYPDYWIEIGAEPEDRKKTLLFCDWSAEVWDSDFLQHAKSQLSKLLSEGYMIYVLQENQLEPLTLETLSSFDDKAFRTKIRPLTKQALTDLAAKKNISPSRLGFISYANTRASASKKFKTYHNEYIEEYVFRSDLERSSHHLFEILSSATSFFPDPYFPCIIEDTLHYGGHDQLPSEKRRTAIASLISHDEKVPPGMWYVNNANIYEFAYFCYIDNFNVIDNKNLKELRIHLSLDSYENLAELKQKDFLPLKMPKLKKLDLAYSKYIKWEIFDFTSLGELEELDLSNTLITAKEIINILKHTQKLKKLNLENCKYIDWNNFGLLSYFASLEEINLSKTSVYKTIIDKLLNNSKHLKKLNISDCDELEINYLSIKHDIPLEFINFSNSLSRFTLEIEEDNQFEFLQILAQHASHLKEIDLCRQQDYLLEIIRGVDIIFKNVKFLTCDFDLDKSYNETIYFINRHFPHLEKLEGCIASWTDYPPEKIAQLKSWGMEPPNFSENISDYKHNIEDHLNYQPLSKEFFNKPFNKDSKLDQTMILKKIFKWLELTDHPLWHDDKTITKLQQGMCNTDAHLYFDMTEEEYEDFIYTLYQWDETLESLKASPETEEYLELLLKYVMEYQLNNTKTNQLIGDDLNNLLKDFKPNHKVVLKSHWHSVVIKQEEDQWIFFDPNFENGKAKKFSLYDLHGLKEAIEDRLAKLFFVESDDKNITPVITNIPEFIKDGGLLCLEYPAVFPMLQNVKFEELDLEILKVGLFLSKPISAIPAWLVGLSQTQIKGCFDFIYQLLEKYATLNSNYLASLEKSVSGLNEEEKSKYYTFLMPYVSQYPLIQSLLDKLNWSPTHSSSTQPQAPSTQKEENKEKIQEILQEEKSKKPKTNIRHLKTIFKTWEIKSKPFDTLDAYHLSLFSEPDHKRIILKTKGKYDLENSILALKKFCKRMGRPFYYIHSPDDLIANPECFVEYNQGRGIIQEGAGGKLYDFIQAHKDNKINPPVFIVNFANFPAKKITQGNTLLEEKNSSIDDIPLPPEAWIVGLTDIQDINTYQGPDLYSRFNKIKNPDEKPKIVKTKKSSKAQGSSTSDYIIDLHGSSMLWKSLLQGSYIMQGDVLIYKQSKIQKALAKNKNRIILRNPPENNSEFNLVYQQMTEENLRYLDTLAGRIEIPENITFSQVNDYSYCQDTLANKIIDKDKVFSNTPYILNPSTLQSFFNDYRVDETTGLYYSEEGLIKKHKKNKTDEKDKLSVYLTRPLNQAMEARLLTACQKHHVELEIKTAFTEKLKHEIYICDDPDYAEDHVKNTKKNIDKIIDISEYHVHDLFNSLQRKQTTNKKLMLFEKRIGAIQKMLDAGETVMLTGNFSNELLDKLAVILQTPTPGKLIIVSNNAQQFQFYPASKRIPVPETYKKEPFIKSQAKKRNPLCSWEGLKSLPIKPFQKTWNLESAEKISQEVDQQRLTLVENALKNCPYTIISGISGGGKSTFTHKVLSQHHDIFYDVDNPLAWLKSPINPHTPNRKQILFIDEANTHKKNWRMFEGLLKVPPGLIIDNEFYPIDPKTHQVVFAINPSDYGGDRKIPEFFQRHGNVIIFDPLPAEYIYQKSLLPILEEAQLSQSEIHSISNNLLNVYAHIYGLSKQELRISPRELKTMALQAVHAIKNKNIPTELAARYYAYQIGKNLLANNEKNQFKQLFGQFTPNELMLLEKVKPPKLESSQFLSTPSRDYLLEQLNNFLDVRAATKSQKNFSGGLGGIVIEGEPGIGKTETAKLLLLKKGYVKNKDFYVIPASWSFNKKRKTLLKAFREGAIVLMDEINSNSEIERLLNDLLMGIDPEDPENKLSQPKPGFMLIGTQNPAYMDGREDTSIAFDRRTLKISLPPYTRDEMISILLKKSCPEWIARKVVKQYQLDYRYAITHRKKPIPTFRDVIKFTRPFFKISQFLKSLENFIDSQKNAQTTTVVEPDFIKNLDTQTSEEIEQLAKDIYIENPTKEAEIKYSDTMQFFKTKKSSPSKVLLNNNLEEISMGIMNDL